MAKGSAGREIGSAVAAKYLLDRREALPALLGRHEDFLIVAALLLPETKGRLLTAEAG